MEKKFIEFINSSPTAYNCVDNVKSMLVKYNFRELTFNDNWENECKPGKYFVTKNDSSIIAFTIPVNINKLLGFNITASHADSPSFSVKPNSEIYDNGYLKLNIGGYGSMINYSWLDRPLSIAGRVIVLDENMYRTININIDKDLLIIPSQALHINREVNSKNDLNHQIDMLPIMSLDDKVSLRSIIEADLSEKNCKFDKICDYDLYLYNRDKAKYLGAEKEFILAPRLDDLACVWTATKSFVDSENDKSSNVLCIFNNEEIGSLTAQGADSTFLSDVLYKIAKVTNKDIYSLLNNSFIVSADNAHAVHPNASSKSDLTNKVYLNQGVVIKHHINYTTDALTSSIFKDMCDSANIKYQDFASRADMRCGSTLGGISQSQVSIDSIDIGIPQLAMHSANELIGKEDLLSMYYALLEFYKHSFQKEKNAVKVLKP